LISLLVSGSCWYYELLEKEGRTSLLSTRLAVLIGSCSYAIYLVHWPIVVAANAIWGEHVPLPIKLSLLCASLLTGITLSGLVERPLRLRGGSDPYRGLKGFVTSGLALGCLLLGLFSTSLGSKIESAGPIDLKAMRRDFDAEFKTARCALVAGNDLSRAEIEHCLVEGHTNIIVIGDSFANAVVVAMRLSTNANVVTLSRPGSPPPRISEGGRKRSKP
jgi:hypothetical protein